MYYGLLLTPTENILIMHDVSSKFVIVVTYKSDVRTPIIASELTISTFLPIELRFVNCTL
jgi:hypothetical protein